MPRKKPADESAVTPKRTTRAKPQPSGPPPADAVYQLKIALDVIKPQIWRRVKVRDMNLFDVHIVIQLVIGWMESHLHMFAVGGEHYSLPEWEMDMEDEEKLTLSGLAAAGVKKFRYQYDMGDSWDHTITIEKVLPAEAGEFPVCVAGERAGPPEDCGGFWGYEDFVAAMADPKDERHEELTEWFGGPFDPEAFDLAAVNKELRRVFGKGKKKK